MTGTQHSFAVAQSFEVLPATLGVHLAPGVGQDPLGDLPSGPQPAIRGRTLQGLFQLDLSLSGEQEAAAGIRMPTVAESLRSALIVAMGEGADPRQAVAGELLDLFGRLSLRHEPDDLPMASLHRVFGLAVTCLDFFEAQMRLDGDWLFHNISIPQELISFGSMAPFVKNAFTRSYRTSIAAIRRINARALVIGVAPEVLPDPLPEGVFALPFAPFSQVYPRCIAVIHHGGPYTVAEALRAGVPSLVVPWGIDQFFTAAQVERLGVGLWRQHRFYTVERAARALSTLIQGVRYKERVQAIAAQIAQEDGVATLCEAIEAILGYPAYPT